MTGMRRPGWVPRDREGAVTNQAGDMQMVFCNFLWPGASARLPAWRALARAVDAHQDAE